MVHSEASSLLYAQNRFDFTSCTSVAIASFLDQMGRNNANYIQHIYIDFPGFECLHLNDVTLESYSACILLKVQNDCNRLDTLTTSLNSTNAMEYELDRLDYPKISAAAISLVTTRFRAIQSLRRITVEVYEDSPSSYMRREMESHGWTVNVREHGDESGVDSRFSVEDSYDYRYYVDSDGNDYDIENDSDFWGRAGD